MDIHMELTLSLGKANGCSLTKKWSQSCTVLVK